MTDTFTGPAAQNIDNAKAQALAAVAQSGSQGKAALDQAAQANAASKTSALKDAMAYAALRGAPQGNVAAGQGMVSAPFDDRAATLAGIGANYAANNQAMSAANEGFFSGARAGLPAVKGMLDQKVAGLQEAAAAKQAALNAQIQSRANANDMAALRLQLAQEKFNASQNPATSVGKFITGLGGADLAGDQLKALVDQAPTGADQIAQPGGGHPAAGVNEVTDPMRDSLPDIVSGTPISPALARQLMTNSEQKDNSQQLSADRAALPTAEGIRNSDPYKSGTTDIIDTVNGANWNPKLYGNVVSSLTSKYGADVARQLLADNASLFRAKGVNPTNLGF